MGEENRQYTKHSDSSDGHRHHSHHSRRNSKLKKIYKKNKPLFRGIMIVTIVLLAMGILALASMLFAKYTYQKKTENLSGKDTNQWEKECLLVGIPMESEPIRIFDDAVEVYMTSDLSRPVEDVLRPSRHEGGYLDNGLPVILECSIERMPAGTKLVKTQYMISLDPNFSEAQTYLAEEGTARVQIYHLQTGKKYYYRACFTLSDGSEAAVQGSFQTEAGPRVLSIDGLVNVRDFGGWKTLDGKTIRQGLIYRGSEMDGSVEKDFKITEQGWTVMLKTLGICYDMDLRSQADMASATGPLGASVERNFYGVVQYSNCFSDEGKASLARVFADLANPDIYPVYMHCTYGVDRTGTVCYLLGAVLGMSDEDLQREYELSALHYGYISTDDFQEFVRQLKQYPGETTQEKAESFLLSAGVTHQQLEAIRQLLLEK